MFGYYPTNEPTIAARGQYLNTWGIQDRSLLLLEPLNDGICFVAGKSSSRRLPKT